MNVIIEENNNNICKNCEYFLYEMKLSFTPDGHPFVEDNLEKSYCNHLLAWNDYFANNLNSKNEFMN